MQWAPQIRPTRAIIDLNAIRSNVQFLFRRSGVPIVAVVKADAYGHGAVEVTRALSGARGLWGVAVSLVEEGLELREAGIDERILVMGPSLMDSYKTLVRESLTPMVSDLRHLPALQSAAKEQGSSVSIHLKFDTGMGRLGIFAEEWDTLLAELPKHDLLKVEGIASHLASADTDDLGDSTSATARQIDSFSALAAKAKRHFGDSVLAHLSNSAGLLRFPGAHWDLCRPGLAIYGGGGFSESLLGAMSLESEVTQLREIPIGHSVSYGGLWTAKRPTRAGLVPLGYADGLSRKLTGSADAIVCGKRVPLLGAISMDMVVVDLTDLPQAGLGEKTTFLGRQGESEIRSSEWAEICGISEYEVTCGISKRVPRFYREPDGKN